MFFARRSEVPKLEPSWFRGLRFSLNTPVVRTEGLPVAPARASLVLYQPPEDPPGVLVGVRSLKSGQVVHFDPEGSIESIEEGLDAAMAFGEGMGFLFDDDELEQGDPERAFGMWHDLMGDPDPAGPLEAAGATPPDDELLLTEPLATGEEGLPALSPTPEITQPQAPPDTDALTSLVENALADAEASPDGALPPLAPLPEPTLTKFRPGAEFEDYALTNPGLPEARPVILEDLSAETDEAAGPDPEADAEVAAQGAAPAELPATRPAEDEDDAADPDIEAQWADRQDAARADVNDAAAGGEDPASVDDAPVEKAARRRGRGRAALGRLRLVKKRLSSADESKRQFLARILSEF